LWALADTVESTQDIREKDAAIAQRLWQGKYANEFATRINDEATSARRIADGLRAEARGWATAWKSAMDEQNRRNRAGKVDSVRKQRSGWERFGDIFLGDDSEKQVAAAPVAATPQPPNFSPTMHEKRY
jgi:hypothetical protein